MRPPPPAAGPTLDTIARERMLLVLDADGALAPHVPESTRALLRTAALLYPCAVVSSRPRAELAPRVDGIPLAAVLGSHGAEPGFGPVDRALARAAARCDAPSAAALRGEAIARLRTRLGVGAAVYVPGAALAPEACRRLAAVAVHVLGADGPGPEAAAGGPPLDGLLRALVAARLEEDGRGRSWQGVVRALAPPAAARGAAALAVAAGATPAHPSRGGDMNETTTGAPLGATIGERLGADPHVKEVAERVAEAPGQARRPRRGGRPFPWAALALGAVGWAALTGIGGWVRGRTRRLGRGARQLVGV
jgi:hypothetical protein